jgi:hypothetical protein
MSQERGCAERPLAGQIEDILDHSSIPEAKWTGGELTGGGYRVMIAGGGCVGVDYVDPNQTPEQHQQRIDQLIQIIREHYGDEVVELQRSNWKVRVELSPSRSSYHMIYVRLNWIMP